MHLEQIMILLSVKTDAFIHQVTLGGNILASKPLHSIWLQSILHLALSLLRN